MWLDAKDWNWKVVRTLLLGLGLLALNSALAVFNFILATQGGSAINAISLVVNGMGIAWSLDIIRDSR